MNVWGSLCGLILIYLVLCTKKKAYELEKFFLEENPNKSVEGALIPVTAARSSFNTVPFYLAI